MNDINVIYNKLSCTYNLVLTETGKLADEGFTINVPIICGKSEFGSFFLYKEDETEDALYVFTYEFSTEQCGEWTHTHPYDTESAIEYIQHFMNGDKSFF